MLTLLNTTTVQSASDPRIQGDLVDCESDVAPQGETFDFNSHEYKKKILQRKVDAMVYKINTLQ